MLIKKKKRERWKVESKKQNEKTRKERKTFNDLVTLPDTGRVLRFIY